MAGFFCGALIAGLLCAFAVLGGCATAPAAPPTDPVVAFAAIPLNGPGKPRLQRADEALNPASVMKLITTYAALDLLGPAFRWNTWLYTDGHQAGDVLHGNLYLVSGGDPSLSRERLWSMLDALRGQGIRQIQGDLVLDGSYLRLPDVWPGFDDDGDNPHAPYLALPHPLLSQLNLVQVRAEADAGVIRTAMTPALPGVTLVDNLRVGPPLARPETDDAPMARCPRSGALIGLPRQNDAGEWQIPLDGVLPEGCGVRRHHVLGAADEHTAATVRHIWRGLGGEISGVYRTGQLPAGSRLVAATTSADLVTVIRDINKHSNNVMTQQLFLTLGAQYRQAGDSDDLMAARRVMREWLAHKGLDVDSIIVDNGSGLSRSERVSPQQLTVLLAQAWRSPWAAEFASSLPLTGIDGSMRTRGRDIAGHGHIKTGSLRDVRAVAGYLRDQRGTTWAVAAIINDADARRHQWRLDQWLNDIVVSR
ncbi:D-alanyl-D-alanine carboxypeptidase/D-alanyl-D-alanine-endopeptidase [Alcanivorax sp. JB21]|uniref:D-alanyl-D-alanine carboxypeptidase/D-alanyl-D-alanine endopeptidase n=1 Tax=Alcanivorax limicola TaxID=2874102 RepID=UPI001CBDFF9B|nr:D-alanyl-D-alanine carboxypeptidase/D-alanyl-D-alanine-endopeptidase [Alcanivorax limicola]MBZ2187832.1 D-alanyl-D-alanine carboxypeptidase/D-alanyl-D-alanine-endopeptidase [Alcanivorax limicola]